MHEVSIVEGIIDAANREIARYPGRVVRAVRVRVGELRQVIPDTLQFCYEVASRGTRLEGSELRVESVPIRARCRRCGLNFDVEEMIFLCPSCTVADCETLAGNELLLTGIELTDDGASSCPPDPAPRGSDPPDRGDQESPEVVDGNPRP